MVEIIHTPTKQDPNSYKVVGDNMEELIEECLKRIRSISKNFYREEIMADLDKNKKSFIDRHAGMGTFYEVILND